MEGALELLQAAPSATWCLSLRRKREPIAFWRRRESTEQRSLRGSSSSMEYPEYRGRRAGVGQGNGLGAVNRSFEQDGRRRISPL